MQLLDRLNWQQRPVTQLHLGGGTPTFFNDSQDFLAISEQMQELRRLGFHSINFDLIYGLPFQNEKTVQKTLDKVLELSPDRISCYNYAKACIHGPTNCVNI